MNVIMNASLKKNVKHSKRLYKLYYLIGHFHQLKNSTSNAMCKFCAIT